GGGGGAGGGAPGGRWAAGSRLQGAVWGQGYLARAGEPPVARVLRGAMPYSEEPRRLQNPTILAHVSLTAGLKRGLRTSRRRPSERRGRWRRSRPAGPARPAPARAPRAR